LKNIFPQSTQNTQRAILIIISLRTLFGSEVTIT